MFCPYFEIYLFVVVDSFVFCPYFVMFVGAHKCVMVLCLDLVLLFSC